MAGAREPIVELIEWFETHDVAKIRALIDAGADVSVPHRGTSITTHFLESYLRSDSFVECLELLLEHGATLDDPGLAPVLRNDPAAIEKAAHDDAAWLAHVVTLRSTFTSLSGVTLLHLAAEYGLTDAARTLLALGVDANAPATTDDHGRGGHTPIFHTVNAHLNRPAEIRRLLIDAGARIDVLVPALVWGEGFEWETTFFDVTPISFCHAGLMRQVHRDERTIFGVIEELLRASRRQVPPLPNVPNRYLRKE